MTDTEDHKIGTNTQKGNTMTDDQSTDKNALATTNTKGCQGSDRSLMIGTTGGIKVSMNKFLCHLTPPLKCMESLRKFILE